MLIAKLPPRADQWEWVEVDEPYIKDAERALLSAQDKVDAFNKNLLWGRGSGASWAHADGEKRLMGLKVLGASLKHDWALTERDKFKCRVCPAHGYLNDAVPREIVVVSGRYRECKG